MIGLDQALPALLRTRFDLFLRFAFQEVGGVGEYTHNWHIDAAIYQLDRIRTGELTRLITTMPPRHLKSFLITVAWVAWMMGNNPGLKFICASYGYDLSGDHARDCLRIMQSSWFRKAFPKLQFSSKALLDLKTTAGGGRLSTSVGGVITGLGGDFIIIDDPMKADDVYSETEREKVQRWFDDSVMQRLQNQETGSIILVMQRLHEDDLAGFLLQRGGWHELRLSAIAPEDERVEVGSGRYYQRRKGHALHPARQSLATLEKRRTENPIVFAAQFDQNPVPLTGNFVDPAWFRYYDERPKQGFIVQSWDTASKPGIQNDYTVAITSCYYEGRHYILNVHRERMDFFRLRALLPELCRRYHVERLLIEDASSGQELITMLRRAPKPGVPLPIACRPEGDKIMRFHAQASRIQAGEVVLPRTAPWLAEFIREIANFPNGRFDDQADALGQLLRETFPQEKPMLAGPIIIYADDAPTTSFDLNDYIDAWGA